MALAATGALLAAGVFVVVPQVPEAQRMLDFAVRGAFITAANPAERDFMLAIAAEAEPLAAQLGYPHLSAARADKDGKIAYLEFVPARGSDARSGPSARVDLYPLGGKGEDDADKFVSSVFKFNGGGEADKILKLEEIKDKDGNASAYAEKLVAGKQVHYAATFRQGARLYVITLRPGPDPDDVPGKDKLRKLIPEGNKE
jgi:hypothetical protein